MIEKMLNHGETKIVNVRAQTGSYKGLTPAMFACHLLKEMNINNPWYSDLDAIAFKLIRATDYNQYYLKIEDSTSSFNEQSLMSLIIASNCTYYKTMVLPFTQARELQIQQAGGYPMIYNGYSPLMWGYEGQNMVPMIVNHPSGIQVAPIITQGEINQDKKTIPTQASAQPAAQNSLTP